MSEGRFEGRVAIVTGAGQGIGRAIAERFASDGASVVVADLNEVTARDVVRSIEAAGGQALAIRTDVTNPADAEALAAQTLARFGRIDVLVNNAGILRSTRTADVTTEEWHLVVDANLTGAFLCARSVYPALRDAGHGRITVNVASMAGRATITLGAPLHRGQGRRSRPEPSHCARVGARRHHRQCDLARHRRHADGP